MKYIVNTLENKNGRIGHQFFNWTLGFVLSKLLNIEFVHSEFCGRADYWDKFLNLGNGRKTLRDLRGLNVVNLPSPGYYVLCHYDYSNINQAQSLLLEWKKIVEEGPDNTVYSLPYNQFSGYLSNLLWDYNTELKDLYWKNKNKHCWDNGKINVAIHIRRGDINQQKNPDRFISLKSYKEVIDTLRSKNKNYLFHVYSEGNSNAFRELQSEDVVLRLNGSDTEAFHELCSADILVTGLSSYSVMAAYLSNAEIVYFPFFNYTDWKNQNHCMSVNDL